jgi:hypothetical protein
MVTETKTESSVDPSLRSCCTSRFERRRRRRTSNTADVDNIS